MLVGRLDVSLKETLISKALIYIYIYIYTYTHMVARRSSSFCSHWICVPLQIRYSNNIENVNDNSNSKSNNNSNSNSNNITRSGAKDCTPDSSWIFSGILSHGFSVAFSHIFGSQRDLTIISPTIISERAANATFVWYGNWNGMEWNGINSEKKNLDCVKKNCNFINHYQRHVFLYVLVPTACQHVFPQVY